MLTCDDVQRSLPGLATGEKATPEIREHLASCDACRAVRDATAADVEGLREGLASLSPSPFLEEAVLDAAHRGAEEAHVRRPWAYVAVAAAAAAALFLVVILPQLGGASDVIVIDGNPSEESEAHPAGPGVDIPPSEGQVRAARDLNRKSITPDQWPHQPSVMRHKDMRIDGRTTEGYDTGSETFRPPSAGAHHRYVYGDANGQAGDRTHWIHAWPPEPGMIVVGAEFLNAIGGTVRRGTSTTIELNGKTWRTAPGTQEGEILLGSPDEGGARARVRVLLSTRYTGSLFIEGPLARALGLHQFEIPGDVHFEVGEQATPGGPVGRRARARVTIPELGFDKIIEVQTVRDRPWQTKLALGARIPDVSILGIPAIAALHARTIRVEGTRVVATSDVGVERVLGAPPRSPSIRELTLGSGAWQVALLYGGAGAVPMIPDVPVLGELFQGNTSEAILRALDGERGHAHRIEGRRVTLEGTWEPKASATIARVWRGKRALPSREAVVTTQVRPDGTISFVRVPGEPGATLRMLVTKADGTSTFHDIVVAPDELPAPQDEIPVGVFASGMVKLPGWEIRMAAGPDEDPLPPEEVARALVAIRDHFRGMAWPRGRHGDQSVSSAELVLHVEKDTRWELVQWLIQMAAAPEVAVAKIRLAPAGETQRAQLIRLPVDQGIQPIDPLPDEIPIVMVKLLWQESTGTTLVRVGNESLGEEETLASRLRVVMGYMGYDPAQLIGQIKTPPPQGLRVPFRDVLEAIRALREVGIEEVRLEGTPAPIPR